MSLDIVRAWKDEAYYLSLSEEERASLPGNPVGAIELTDADLEAVFGGKFSHAQNCQSNAGSCNSNNCNQSNAKICDSNGGCISNGYCISFGVCSGGCSNAFICI